MAMRLLKKPNRLKPISLYGLSLDECLRRAFAAPPLDLSRVNGVHSKNGAHHPTKKRMKKKH